MEDQEKSVSIGNKIKNILKGGILAGALIGSRGEGLDQNANAQAPDKERFQSQNLENKVTIPEVARDEQLQNPEAPTEVKFTALTTGIKSGFETPENIIIKDQQTLDLYWKKMNQDPNIPTPSLKQGEIIVLSALGNRDTLTATLITKVEKGDTSIFVNTESYDIGQDTPEKSSPFDAILIDGDSNLPFTFNNTQMPGKYDFNVAVSSKTDGEGNSQYSGATISVEPRE